MGWANRIIDEGEEAPESLLGSAHPRNWRLHPPEQERALSGVLNGVGVVGRVIKNARTGRLIDGHLRVALAVREGVESVPVEYVDLSEEEEALVLATFDPIAGMARADRAQLDALLAEARESGAAAEEPDVSALLDSVGEGRAADGGSEAEDGSGDAEPDAPGVTDAGGSSWVRFEVVMTAEDHEAYAEARALVGRVYGFTGDDAVREGQAVAALAQEYLAGYDGKPLP